MSKNFEKAIKSRTTEALAQDGAAMRPLGFGEARMHLMQTESHGTTQGATVLSVHGPLAAASLEAAFSHAWHAHDILRARIVERDDAFVFVTNVAGRPPRLTAVPRISAQTWVELVERENSQPLDVQWGLWRPFLVSAVKEATDDASDARSEIVLIAHHAILDGTAASVLLRRILDEVAHPSGSWSRRRLRPSTEVIVSSGHSWESFRAKQAALEREIASLPLMRHVARAPLEERVTRVVPIAIGRPAVDALARNAEAASTSLYSLLSALLLLAVRSHSPDRSRFALQTAISMRSLCERAGWLDGGDLGCYLSVVSTVHDVTGKTSATLAREHRDALYGAAFRYGRTPAQPNLMAMRRAIQAAATQDVFTHDIVITYLEDEEPTSADAVRLKEHYITANRAAGMAALVLHAVRRNGQLFLTMNFTAPLQRDAWARSVAETLQELIEGQCRASEA